MVLLHCIEMKWGLLLDKALTAIDLPVQEGDRRLQRSQRSDCSITAAATPLAQAVKLLCKSSRPEP